MHLHAECGLAVDESHRAAGQAHIQSKLGTGFARGRCYEPPVGKFYARNSLSIGGFEFQQRFRSNLESNSGGQREGGSKGGQRANGRPPIRNRWKARGAIGRRRR